jgi:hypothetical protein
MVTSARAGAIRISIDKVTLEGSRGILLLGAVVLCLIVGAIILFFRRK